MSNIVYIRYMISGNIFQEIKYNNFNDLCDKLKLMIIHYDSDLLMQLLINDNILNNFDVINTLALLNLNKNNYISVIFSNKKDLYCLGNDNGKYILDCKEDNYSILLSIIIYYYKNDSYDIIINNSYNDIVLKAVKQDGYALQFVNFFLQNNKEVVLEAVRKNGLVLEYANIDLQDNKEIVLEAVKQDGYALQFASINLQNNKEVVLEAVKQNGLVLNHISINLQDNKEIVLEAVKQDGYALQFASINLQDNKEIVLEAVKQNKFALQFASIDLQDI